LFLIIHISRGKCCGIRGNLCFCLLCSFHAHTCPQQAFL
jgi:hypothetical protein